jgi:hypothetical protein
MRRFVVAGLALVTGGALWAVTRGQPNRNLSIDAWWSLDYAQNACDAAAKYLHDDRALIEQFGCGSVTSCPELTVRVKACGPFTRGDVLRFLDRLKAQLASDILCKGLVVAEYDGPNSQESPEASRVNTNAHSTLIVDYIPGALKQNWTLQRDGGSSMAGEGEPESIAASICAIMSGGGAEVTK